MDKTYQLGIRCILSFLNPVLEDEKEYKIEDNP